MSAALETQAPAGDEREERYRLAALAASGPLLLLLAPLFLPFTGSRSLLRETRGELGPLLILFGIFVGPLFVGALGLRRALTRRAPAKAAFAVPALLHLLLAVGVELMLMAILADKARARESPPVWIVLGMAMAISYVIARGFRRAGWERWAQLVCGVWLTFAVGAVLAGLEMRELYDAPEIGAWVLLFALGAAAPAVGWILWPKRRSSDLPAEPPR